MKNRVSNISLGLLFFLSGCVTSTSHYGSRPDFTKLEIGMTQQQAIAVLGKPVKIAASTGSTYLQYGWDNPWDGRIGAAEEFFVRVVGGKVDAFGEKGDFDSTKNQTIEVKKEVTVK